MFARILVKPAIMFSILISLCGISLAQETNQHDSSMNHETMDHSKMDHSAMMKKPQAKMPVATEGGQGAFTAIAEIVALLQADPETDWSKVDINKLREHLVDMNELAINAKVTSKMTDGNMVFAVTGTGRTIQAVQAMVPAHAKVLANTTDWKTQAKLTDTGAILTVGADNPDEMQKIKALGFFGVMATGAHHQAHHVLMATGAANVHQH